MITIKTPFTPCLVLATFKLQQTHNQHNNFVGSGLEKALPDYMQASIF